MYVCVGSGVCVADCLCLEVGGRMVRVWCVSVCIGRCVVVDILVYYMLWFGG